MINLLDNKVLISIIMSNYYNSVFTELQVKLVGISDEENCFGYLNIQRFMKTFHTNISTKVSVLFPSK